MRIAVVGVGYVGSVQAAGLAELGNHVTCIDVDKEKVNAINSGRAPVFEPGLDVLIRKNVKRKKLSATTNGKSAIAESEIVFICVGTPSRADGSTDLRFVEEAASNIGRALAESKKRPVVVVKSTVPPGTTEKIVGIIEKTSGKKFGDGFGACANPEFLREGNAVFDFFNPDRIVVGAQNKMDVTAMRKLYTRFKCPFLQTDWRTAEMIKYASNAFLATKISFINEIANICQKLGIDVYDIADGMGLDRRIGRAFLNAGVGFGGSCFPKDVASLAHTARSVGVEPRIIQAVLDVNAQQPLKTIELAKEALGTLRGKRIAVLGLAFKENTDDMREAPSLKVIPALLKEGASVIAHDPKAMENAKNTFGEKIAYAESAHAALKGSDACIILTAWKEYKRLSQKDFSLMASKPAVVIEGRDVLPRKALAGLCYRGIGRKSVG
ncbi:MAG: UDP-glucose/GDP-mannose dehydrogenase family protein [Candidatus Micrarchaeia archaeon]